MRRSLDRGQDGVSFRPKVGVSSPSRRSVAAILLIDDDSGVRSIVRAMLERMGHDVLTAADGNEGLDVFRRYRAEIVITDLLMPFKEGLETIRELRQLAPDLLVLAISGGGRTLSAERVLDLARSLGADGVLEKPFGQAELEAALGELNAI